MIAPVAFQQPPPAQQGQASGYGGAAPLARPAGGEKNDTPAIPETELISVLTEIVKKDADPSVRNEALQGLYHLRTDNSITALIQLYDTLTDVKVKGDILSNLMRRKGDNSKAIAKVVSVAKTEKDETLRNRALNAMVNIKGDEGADHLIAIYDSLQDAKMKQSVIRALAMNKGKKAVDKLIQIAKNDSDPTIRQYAVRAITNIDGGNLYLEMLEKARTGISNIREVPEVEWRFDDQTWEQVRELAGSVHHNVPLLPPTPPPARVAPLSAPTDSPTPSLPAPKRR
jgi:hypothetical protein